MINQDAFVGFLHECKYSLIHGYGIYIFKNHAHHLLVTHWITGWKGEVGIAFGTGLQFCISSACFEVLFVLHGHPYLNGFRCDTVSRVVLYYFTLFLAH